VVYSSSDVDAQAILSGESEDPLKKLAVYGPNGLTIVKAQMEDEGDLGQADFQFDTPEPTIQELEEAYPEGTYWLLAVTIDDETRMESVDLSYDLLNAPVPTFPTDGATNVAVNGLTITWQAVEDAEEIRVEIEDEGEGTALEADLAGDATSFNVPDGWLQSDMEYVLDIEAEGSNGNVTVTDLRFTTAGVPVEVPDEEEPGPGELEDVEIYLVYSATDDDIQVMIQAGSDDGLVALSLEGPGEIVPVEVAFADGADLGQADMTFESPEPSVSDLMAAYPAGEYTFTGTTVEDDELEGSVELSYDLLDAPNVTFPAEGGKDIPVSGLMITWDAVANAEEVRLEIEDEEEEATFSVDLPGDAVSFTVPDGWLQNGVSYVLDVEAGGDNGNWTVTDVAFTTVN